MDILDTTVIPEADTVYTLREIYQNEPRIVEVTITGTGTVTLFGRASAKHTWKELITVTDEDFMGAIFLPRKIKAVPTAVDGRIVVSVNVSEAVTVDN
jgi:hypothetical protein